ncbi:sugar phosphate isomerase/epimerase [Allokutzneria sp. A3M-2-11 16]|uniref:sugar phosphate isomerase/epimerase family protein n=1 Tax=Allokutzneria sp. A3M-2-11 16 TaxID=2962043 RepID=UPI0020B65164|nr:sugar phosphate isomerase/epimerase family protein [Allokutzneria sp. A3M-2-11 16]MCP3803097.1 sugar phosphate isomerase/epimerase [Allokutzneria sp. A3M-2-11 16]
MWTLSGFADEISPELDVQCRVLRELGVGHVEFRSAWDTNVLDLDDVELELVRETLSRNELAVSSIGSPIGKIGVRDDFEEHLLRLDRALHVAKVLAAPYIRIFSFFLPAADDPAAHRDEVLRRMTRIAERATGHGVILLHENEKSIYGDTPERCLDVVESVGSPSLRLAWDAANFVQCGVRPYTDGYRLLRPHVEYVQIKDAIMKTGEVVPAGHGDGEVAETVRALREDGFDGFFSLEPHLIAAGPMGGFSGPQLYGVAHRAFTDLLTNEGIDYR